MKKPDTRNRSALARQRGNRLVAFEITEASSRLIDRAAKLLARQAPAVTGAKVTFTRAAALEELIRRGYEKISEKT